MTQPATTPLLRDRASVRIFDPAHELSDEDLATLLHAAQWAPSAGNSQPWAFLVSRRGDATHEVVSETLSRGNTGWVPQASAVLITAAQVATDEDGTGPAFSDYAHYDLGQAVAHLTLQARALGLETHQFAGFDHEAIAERLAVPAYFQVMTGVAIGRRGDPATADPLLREREERARVRKPLTEFAYAGPWGTPL